MIIVQQARSRDALATSVTTLLHVCVAFCVRTLGAAIATSTAEAYGAKAEIDIKSGCRHRHSIQPR